MSEDGTAKPQLHVSMLSTLSRCGIQFQRRYGKRFGVWDREEKIPPGAALVVGISTHQTVELNCRHLLENEALLSDEAVKQAARDFCANTMAGEMRLTPEESVDLNKTVGAAIDQTVALSYLHHRAIAPKLKPLAVEEPFVIEMNGYPIDLAGKIDLREDQVVRDVKTLRARPPEGAARSMQFGMYSLAHKIHYNKLPAKIKLDALIKTKEPKALTIEAVPDELWVNPLLFRIQRFCDIIDAVKSGKQAFTPAQPDDWVCSKKYCGYAETCQFWSGR
jgi:hypothetical protein